MVVSFWQKMAVFFKEGDITLSLKQDHSYDHTFSCLQAANFRSFVY